MKVGIDISSLNSMSKGRGIGFYTEYLIESLKKYTDMEVVVINKPNQKESVDLIHYPFFDFFKPSLKIRTNIPTVVTIHDVIPLLFPKHYPSGIKGRINLFRQKQSLKKVKAIITDSNSSTRDVIKIFNLPPKKISTVYLGPPINFKKLPEKEINKSIIKFNLPKNFVLFTGGVNWNKNLINQTKAALSAETDIVFVGGGFKNRDNLSHSELKEFNNFLSEFEQNSKVHILGFIDNDEIAALMNAAKILLFASRYEGFGLPILEAQSCQTPVITGNTSSMIEVAGDGAILVNPDSVEEIKSAIISIFENKKLTNELIERGDSNVKKFSWEKTALETVEVYKNALS